MARASAVMRLSIAAGCALITVAALPPRLWKAQLRRLGLLALLLFLLTALASGLVSLCTLVLILTQRQTCLRVCHDSSTQALS